MDRVRWLVGILAAAVAFAIAAAFSVVPRRRRPPPSGPDRQRGAVVDAEAADTKRADDEAEHRLAAIRSASEVTDVDAAARAVADMINRGKR